MSISIDFHRTCLPGGRWVFIALVSLSSGLGNACAQALPDAAPSMKQAPAQAPTEPPAFRSAFEGYQPYIDDGPPEWKKANDTVGQIGGWRAYIREAQRGASADGKPQSQPAPVTPPPPHTGQTKP